MIADFRTALSRVATAMGCAVVAAATLAGPSIARADDASLPVFVPHPSGWSPNYTVFPYNLWQNRVTPQMVDAERDACQWFNAQFDALSAQSWGFQRALHDNFDSWDGVQGAANVLKANIDQSAAFLDPRVHTLYITNYPDQSQYSPLFHGDSFFHIWYQLTQLSDKIARQLPSGVINANNATMKVYGDAIRSSGVCIGA
ncbi:MAG: hypothetical protein KIH64_002210 [Mycobacterium sp.]|nr:hypothetical protein [Mycobacterium sp.]